MLLVVCAYMLGCRLFAACVPPLFAAPANCILLPELRQTRPPWRPELRVAVQLLSGCCASDAACSAADDGCIAADAVCIDADAACSVRHVGATRNPAHLRQTHTTTYAHAHTRPQFDQK